MFCIINNYVHVFIYRFTYIISFFNVKNPMVTIPLHVSVTYKLGWISLDL